MEYHIQNGHIFDMGLKILINLAETNRVAGSIEKMSLAFLPHLNKCQ